MIAGLVNLITPAYNSGSFISRLLDSVLMQTYPMIKMYLVDDGSTDNTREVIEGYVPLFAKKGYELRYVYQENAGVSFAINNALKLVDGEFLLWPDSDDWFKEPYAIEKLVGVLQNSDDEVGVARCRKESVSEHGFQVIKSMSFPFYGVAECVLEDAVYDRNGFEWGGGNFMIKTSLLDIFIPNRNIYTEKEAGQNYQLLLPYFANSKCISIDDVLFCYLVREGSHCRTKGFEKEIGRVEAYARTWANVFDAFIREKNSSKLEEYRFVGLKHWYYELLRIDIEYNATRSIHRHIKECMELGVPLAKRYRKICRWTKLFSIKSYFMISECHSNLQGYFKRHN